MSRNNEGSVLADVAGGLFGSLLDDEASESTEIYILAVCEAVLYHGHKLFNNGNNRSLVNAGCLCDFSRYFCFSHFCIALNLMSFRLQNYKKQLYFGTNTEHIAACGGRNFWQK